MTTAEELVGWSMTAVVGLGVGLGEAVGATDGVGLVGGPTALQATSATRPLVARIELGQAATG
jgi:hypothetical protein